MMAVMTAQPPLPLMPTECPPGRCGGGDHRGRRRWPGVRARQPGLRLGCRRHRGAPVRGGVADADQGRHPAGGRRGVRGAPATVRRWDAQHCDAGVAGLLPERKGPKRKSKLTGDTVAAIRRLRAGGASYRAVAAGTGVSEGSVRNALKPAGADIDTDEPASQPVPMIHSEQEQEAEPKVEAEGRSLRSMWVPRMIVRQRLPLSSAAPPVRVPVLADPVDAWRRSGRWRRSG